jgi:hypothetical protein
MFFLQFNPHTGFLSDFITVEHPAGTNMQGLPVTVRIGCFYRLYFYAAIIIEITV